MQHELSGRFKIYHLHPYCLYQLHISCTEHIRGIKLLEEVKTGLVGRVPSGTQIFCHICFVHAYAVVLIQGCDPCILLSVLI